MKSFSRRESVDSDHCIAFVGVYFFQVGTGGKLTEGVPVYNASSELVEGQVRG